MAPLLRRSERTSQSGCKAKSDWSPDLHEHSVTQFCETDRMLKMNLRPGGLICSIFSVVCATAQSLNCDLREYRRQPGLSADVAQDTVRLSWQGERGHELRASFTVSSG